MPCFEGLFFESCDSPIQDLLFTLAFWHGYAKLRLHSDSSVRVLEGATSVFGTLIREFKNVVCPRYKTKLTAREQQARDRRKKGSHSAVEYVFNLSTYKLHAMGDYASSIPVFGTTDNTNAQNVSRPIFSCHIRLTMGLG